MDSQTLLQKVDDTWFSQLSPGWMDVLGDHAGAALVLIDGGQSVHMMYESCTVLTHRPSSGDAICQQVLNDPLLALGKSQGLPLFGSVPGDGPTPLKTSPSQIARFKYCTLYGASKSLSPSS